MMREFLTAHQAVLDWAASMPEQVFLSQPVAGQLRTWTWQAAADDSRRMACALRGLGLKPGDRVGILAKNCAEWLLADVAIAMPG